MFPLLTFRDDGGAGGGAIDGSAVGVDGRLGVVNGGGGGDEEELGVLRGVC